MEILILALATWRISTMLVWEDGPSYIFERMRHTMGIRRFPENPDEKYAEPDGAFLPSLFLCTWCLSLWIGLFWTLLYLLSNSVAFYLALPFSLSAASCLIEDLRTWR